MNQSQVSPLRVRVISCLLAGLVLASGCGPAKVEPPANAGDPSIKPEPARKKTQF